MTLCVKGDDILQLGHLLNLGKSSQDVYEVSEKSLHLLNLKSCNLQAWVICSFSDRQEAVSHGSAWSSNLCIS